MMNIEEKRELLETLDRIEEALVTRIRKSDAFLPTTINTETRHIRSRPYSARENAVRRWEAARLVDQYNDLRQGWSDDISIPAKSSFKDELAAVSELDDEVPAVNIANKFALHKEKRGRPRFLCDQTESVVRTIDSTYPARENYGETLDLEPFYRKLISSSSSDAMTYREYLASFSKFVDTEDSALLDYLIDFYDRANAVGSSTGTTAREQLALLSEDSESYPALYCQYCERDFANENVFNAHLNGKKHKRALKENKAPAGISLPKGKVCVNKLVQLLEPALQNTIAQIDRKLGMSVQDRQLEVDTLERERDLEDSWRSEDEVADESKTDKDTQPIVKVLRGPEGTPIPRWLFRLQGLGVIFRCEICGPHAKYAGRKGFDKHFNDATHLKGLKNLGITPSPIFEGITGIQEAKDLQRKQNDGTTLNPALEKEVEDDEGNALSESMYEDLKKQGLL